MMKSHKSLIAQLLKLMNPIALITDFGHTEAYAGILKGVIASIAPECPVIDITHDIPAQDIFQAAIILKKSYGYFPRGTIFMCVVDPGVGGHRKAICLVTPQAYFVGPDNGIFTFITEEEKSIQAYELTNQKYFCKPVSNTFHGRDIFAPCAAHLAKGISPFHMGPRTRNLIKIPLPQVRFDMSKKTLQGEVMTIDIFGNLLTNIKAESLPKMYAGIQADIKGHKILGLDTSYAAQKKGKLLNVIGSSGYWEIAVNLGHAAKHLRAKRGSIVTVTWS